jgi:uncharacterized protein YgiM (DUF1202 family)
MTTTRTGRACDLLWAGLMIVIALTSCNPYATLPANSTATPNPSATANPVQKIEQGTATPTPRPTCTVNGDSVYLRAGAGMNYAAIDVLHKGEAVTVIYHSEWIKVITRKHTGYVYSKFCTGE